MIMYNEMLNVILLAGNLFVSGSLFLYVCKDILFTEKKTAVLAVFFEWILESAVFIASIVRISGLIMTGIMLPGDMSAALLGVRAFYSESMILLWLCAQVWIGKKGMSAHGKGEFLLAMFLLLVVTFLEWGEKNSGKACALQIGVLFTAASLLYFRNAGKTQIRNPAEPFSQERQIPLRQQIILNEQKQDIYLKNVDLQYQKTRELWHDLKNHINVLEILAKEERFSELTDYLGSFRQEVEIHMLPMKTGCTAVDALLSDKMYHARKAHIEISLQLCSLSETAVRYIDLCTVLGNLLDNAIEACERLQERESAALHGQEQSTFPGWIKVKMKEQDHFYYLTIANSAPEPDRSYEKKSSYHGDDASHGNNVSYGNDVSHGNDNLRVSYLSSKKKYDNVAGHGLGLRSVERIVHQYNGSMAADFDHTKKEFRVIVRMENPVLEKSAQKNLFCNNRE